MKRTLIVVAAAIIAVVSLAAAARPSAPPASVAPAPTSVVAAAPTSLLVRAGFPAPEAAKRVLSAALMQRHPQYLDITSGSAAVRSFVVFPDGGERAPVVVLTANDQGMTDWLRAVGNDAAANGFVAVVPDLRRDQDAAAFMRDAIVLPASNGRGALVRINFAGGAGRIDVTTYDASRTTTKVAPGDSRTFDLGDHAWHRVLAHMGQLDSRAQQAGRGGEAAGRGRGRGAEGEAAGGMRAKRPNLPANFLMAAKTVAQSPRKGEWIDIPMQGGKLHTWISYPQNVTKAPVVLVFQPGPGMDMGEPITRGGGANWLRAIADQLAYEGFIAVLPDLTSGLGPNGGNYDSFQFPDESGAAINRIPHADVIKRIQVAADYALKLPMANGRLGATGFCMGGGLAWEVAAEVPQVNASVVFYGGPPPEPVMARIHAPVAAFFGENDLGLAPRVAPATADMKRLGKEFSVEVYKEATHVFLYRQDLGRNQAATEDAWPKAMAFFKKHLTVPASK
jgi:carboxymethylenebutenolidase